MKVTEPPSVTGRFIENWFAMSAILSPNRLGEIFPPNYFSWHTLSTFQMSTLHVIHFGSQALMVCDCSAAVTPIHARQGACTICGHSFAMIELLLPSGVVRVPLAQIGMMAAESAS